MMRWTQRVFLTAAALLVVGVVALPPAASADPCKVTATLLNGTTETFTVNAAPGTPPAEMLPPGTGPVSSVSANCDTTGSTSGSLSSGSSGSTKPKASHAFSPNSSGSNHDTATTPTSSSQPTGNSTRPPPTSSSHVSASAETPTARATTKTTRQAHPAKAATPPTQATAPSRPKRPARQTRRRATAPRSKPSQTVTPPLTAVAATKVAARTPGQHHHQRSNPLPWVLLGILALVATGFAAPLARRRRARSVATAKVMTAPEVLSHDHEVLATATTAGIPASPQIATAVAAAA
ncbi:MAG TPA: hypothetical protein VMD09_04650, partial [Solirubrobacteraceae bacterium]|nr:hypothetical protein [Solirubrobacteraceae bacterium]